MPSCLQADTNPDVREDGKILLQDLLSLHMVRKTTTSTIISYHPSLQGTSAQRLQSLAHRTGDSVYWSKNFTRSKDPTFLLLAILWYALYEWDESLELLYQYISDLVGCIASLEPRIRLNTFVRNTGSLGLTRSNSRKSCINYKHIS